jgi:hypothetical protein
VELGRRAAGAFLVLLGLLVAGIGAIGPVAVCIYLAVGPWGWLFVAVPVGIAVAIIAIRGGVRVIDRGISAMVDRAP